VGNQSGLQEPKWNELSSQNEEVYPEKVEMMVDPAEETTKPFLLGITGVSSEGIKAFLGRKGLGERGEDPLVVADSGFAPAPSLC
jgi:hypothetical protein